MNSDSSAQFSLPEGGPHAALQALRTRAEQRRQLVTRATDHEWTTDTQRLVQELQVHQIELEMQYEEVLLAQAEAQAARAEYVDLYDFAPVGYFSLTEAGLVKQLNLCASQQLGAVRQRLLGRRLALFVAPAQRLDFGQFLARVFSTDTTQSVELLLLREDGTPFHAQLEGLRVEAPTGPQCRLAVLDVTARQQATDALAASEARFRKLFNDSGDAVVLLQGHQYVDCNDAALRLLGARHKEQVVGRGAWAFAPETQPDGRRTIDVFHETTKQAISAGSKRCEAVMRRLSGEEFWAEAVLTPIELGGPTPLVHILWRDVTAARTAENELRQAKEFTESLLENTVDGIIALDREQRVTGWNSQAAFYFGPTAHEALGRPVLEVLPHLDPTAARQIFERVLAGEPFMREGQRFPHRAGHYDAFYVPLKKSSTAVPTGVLIMFRDVTERNRLAEEATQLRLRQQQEVLAAILTTQESERKRIAEALHNGLGQVLYATRLSLESTASASAPPSHALRLLDEAIRATRTISFELTPGILEDFGLATALQSMVKRMAPASLPVQLHLANLDERLSPNVEITVYRVVQELLNNVMKHANATEVVMHVVREDGRLEASVEDNGRGFDPAALASQPLAGIGLAGVRNRVALLGGELSVKSQPGRGTVVSFELVV